LGNFLAICILLSLGRVSIARTVSHRFILIAAMGVMLTGLFTTLSRTAFAGLAAGTVYFAIYSKRLRKPLAFSLLAFVAIALVVTKGNVIVLFFERFFSIFEGLAEVSAKRVASWRDALELFFMSPVIGMGFGEYSRIIEAASPELFLLKVHNVYLAVLSELGMVGFLIFMGMLVSIFAFAKQTLRLVKENDRCYQLCLAASGGLITYLVCTLSQAIYVQERGMWSFIGLSMAIFVISRKEVSSQPEAGNRNHE
jgi:O-antigen ligase